MKTADGTMTYREFLDSEYFEQIIEKNVDGYRNRFFKIIKKAKVENSSLEDKGAHKEIIKTTSFNWFAILFTTVWGGYRRVKFVWIECSLSRRGECWDNAAMESFFSSLKSERLNRRTYRSRDDVRADVFSYIEQFYNPRRRHSTLGYVSPMEYEKQAGFA